MATIDEELRCVHCGYNLRTLAVEGVCPECGTIVADSILNDQDAGWLGTIRQGLAIMVLAGPLYFVLPNVHAFLVLHTGLFQLDFRLRLPWPFQIYVLATFLAYVVPVLAICLAVWKIGSPARALSGSPWKSPGRTLRLATILWFANWFVGYMVVPRFTPLSPALWIIDIACWYAIDAYFMLVFWRRVAFVLNRLGHVFMARHATIMGWLLAAPTLSLGVWWLVSYLIRLSDAGFPATLDSVDAVVHKTNGVATLILGAWSLFLIVRARVRICGERPAGFWGDIRAVLTSLGARIRIGWRWFVEKLRYHGSPPQEAKLPAPSGDSQNRVTLTQEPPR